MAIQLGYAAFTRWVDAYRTGRITMSARLKCRGWKLYATAVASFACGSVITAHLTHVQEVKADSNRVFELMVYHTEPGKVPSVHFGHNRSPWWLGSGGRELEHMQQIFPDIRCRAVDPRSPPIGE
jgi:hypothetical protein